MHNYETTVIWESHVEVLALERDFYKAGDQINTICVRCDSAGELQTLKRFVAAKHR